MSVILIRHLAERIAHAKSQTSERLFLLLKNTKGRVPHTILQTLLAILASSILCASDSELCYKIIRSKREPVIGVYPDAHDKRKGSK